MSVRDFANHPCGFCKSDTLHIAMRCQECGNVQVHPHEQFERITEKQTFAQGRTTQAQLKRKPPIPEPLRKRYAAAKARLKRAKLRRTRAT